MPATPTAVSRGLWVVATKVLSSQPNRREPDAQLNAEFKTCTVGDTTQNKFGTGLGDFEKPLKRILSGISGRLRTVAVNVSTFNREVIDAAKNEREVTFTTFGRKTGKPYDVTIFVVTDGHRLFIVSGQGMARQWPRNLAARGDGVLHLGGLNVHVKSRHVIDPGETRMISELYGSKYGPRFGPPQPGEPPRLSQQATFELIPAGS